MEKHSLYNGTEELIFYGGDRHEYIVNGESLPTSTKVTGLLDKPNLRYWYVNQAIQRVEKALRPGVSLDEVQIANILKSAKYGGNDARDEAAQIGRVAHSWCESHVRQLMGEIKKADPMPKHSGAVRACEKFLEWEYHVQPNYIFAERAMFSKQHRFAGTVDIVAYIDPFHLGLSKKSTKDTAAWLPTVVDIKTGSGIYPEYSLQLASYAALLSEERPIQFPEKLKNIQRLVINAPKTTKPLVTKLLDSDITEDYEVFLSLLKAYRWKNAS